MLEDGTYPGGRLTVQPLPEQVYGRGTLRTFALRRIQSVISDADAQDHIERELLKVGLSPILPSTYGSQSELSQRSKQPNLHVSSRFQVVLDCYDYYNHQMQLAEWTGHKHDLQ